MFVDRGIENILRIDFIAQNFLVIFLCALDYVAAIIHDVFLVNIIINIFIDIQIYVIFFTIFVYNIIILNIASSNTTSPVSNVIILQIIVNIGTSAIYIAFSFYLRGVDILLHFRVLLLYVLLLAL